MKHRTWLYAGLLVLGIGLPVAAGLFSRGVSKGEGAKVVLRFPPSSNNTSPAMVDIARFGIIKDALQRWRMRIYVRVENATQKPHKVRVTLDGCPLQIDWHARDYTWDDTRRALDEPLLPNQRFGIYLFTAIPEELRDQARLCDGVLRAFDDDTGELLATSRLQIINSSLGGQNPQASQGHEGEHHHDGALHN